MTGIKYDPALNPRAGFLDVVPKPRKLSATETVNLTDDDRNTLLHLLFSLTYTQEGRDLMRWEAVTDQNEEAIKSRVRTGLVNKYGLTIGKKETPKEQRNADLVEALVEGHIAASRFVSAVRNGKRQQDGKIDVSGVADAGKRAEAEEQQTIYRERLLFIMQCLEEDARDHEFSMLW